MFQIGRFSRARSPAGSLIVIQSSVLSRSSNESWSERLHADARVVVAVVEPVLYDGDNRGLRPVCLPSYAS
jgi:hypothetical protein